MVRGMALLADRRGHEPMDVAPGRSVGVRRARSVTDLALDVRQRLFGGPDPIPRRAPVAHDVARDASRLVMAGHLEGGLVGGGALGGLSLGVFALAAHLTF